MKTIAFFGHNYIFDKQQIKNLIKKLLNEKIPLGYTKLLVGNHGDFDDLTLHACVEYKKFLNPNIEVTLVLSSLGIITLNPDFFCDFEKQYNIMIYDIEEIHYKRRISYINKKMIDNSDLIICYFDNNKKYSNTEQTLKYAKNQNKEIINLFNYI